MTGENTAHIAVLGAGAWGTALAAVMASAGRNVSLWTREPEAASAINRTRQNTAYLPGIGLDERITATASLGDAIEPASIVLLVTPAQTIAGMASRLKPMIAPQVPIVLCAKGINRETGLLPAESLAGEMPGHPLAALSGPGFAGEVVRGLPTAVTLAASNLEMAGDLARRLSAPSFRLYASDDIKGAELGGALKNVIALAAGACRGMELGASAEAALIARGFAELTRLAAALGARPQTLMGLSGLGDLVLTCSSTQSRNFSYGMALGKGSDTDDLPLAEGAFTAGIAQRLAEDAGIECPLIATVSALVDRSITPAAALDALLNRPLKSERE